jgi:phosphoribosylformylglycinamidine synthase
MLLSFDHFKEKDLVKILFSENIGVVIQAKDDNVFESKFNTNGVEFFKIGSVTNNGTLDLGLLTFDIPEIHVASYNDYWSNTVDRMVKKQITF